MNKSDREGRRRVRIGGEGIEALLSKWSQILTEAIRERDSQDSQFKTDDAVT